MKATVACIAVLSALLMFNGAVHARPAQFEQSISEGASRKLLKAIDIPWGFPAFFNSSGVGSVTVVDANTSRYRDVAAVVGDTITIHWNGTFGANFSLWQIPTDTCPANFTQGPGTAQIVAAHKAATVTLKLTAAGVVVFTSAGPGHCEAGVLVNIVVSQGAVIPTAIYVAQNVTAPGPAVAPMPAAAL
ncbi:hypothetical protein ABBQ32_009965 [Trebouxia sp. C0010 RCD-2024]